MTRAEIRWVLLASLAVLLLASLPTLYAWSLADDEKVFTGFVYNVEDSLSYIGKMRLGARGEWLVHLFYTPEPHEPALVYPFYLILGKLAEGLGLPLVTAFHVARVVLGLGLLLTVYAFVAAFTPEIGTRRLAWALVAIGSGLGWLLVAVGRTDWLGALPLDFWVPEAYVFLVLYSLPHLALAELLLLWAVLWTLDALQGRGLRRTFVAGLCTFLMSWIVPFYAGVLSAALAAFLLALAIRHRRIPWRETGLIASTVAFALPSLLYNAWVFTQNPAFRTWAAQNRTWSPHPLHYVLGYAPLLVPAVWGGSQAIRSRDERWYLPVAWVLAVPFLLYVPFTLQRRLIAAVQMPLALLAGRGLRTWFGKWRRGGILYIALASVSNVLLVAGSFGTVQQRAPPIFRPAAEIAAFSWLQTHAKQDEIVLCSFDTGNALPAWSDLRVFAGHGPETLHSADKEAELLQFFRSQTDDAWRRRLLRRYDVDYVLRGPQEQALGNWDPGTAVYLASLYEVAGYAIYEVTEGQEP
jgi:hypothetical protein